MNTFLISFTVFVLALSASQHSLAEAYPELFSDQRNLYTAQNKDMSYRLTLSPLKKINSEWLAEREELMKGRLERRTVQIELQLSLKILWSQIQSYFEAKKGNIIFECNGLDCGASNAWANTRFEVKQLYGLDVMQHYQVWELNEDSQIHYAVVYLIERGDKRIYLQIDKLVPNQNREPLIASPSVMAKNFYLDGQLNVPGLKFDDDNMEVSEPAIKALVKALNEKPFKKYIVVGHDYQQGSLEEQKDRAMVFAQSIADRLIKLGINKRRIHVEAVGSLAPDRLNPDAKARVVIVLQ